MHVAWNFFVSNQKDQIFNQNEVSQVGNSKSHDFL
jgi:hypothetical protein